MKRIFLGLCWSLFCALNVNAATGYQKPEDMVGKLVRADSFSTAMYNPQTTALLKAYFQETPSIKYVSRPKVRLGGVRFNPSNYTAISNYYINRLTYFDMKTKKERSLGFPKDSILRQVSWSADGKHIAISNETDSCHEVWIVPVPSLAKYKVPGVCLNAVLGRTLDWMTNDEVLIGARTAAQRGALKMGAEVPTGPVVLESKGTVSQNRTYQDLIKTQQDEKAFATAAESQIGRFSVKTRAFVKIGKPGIFKNIESSPNGKLVLVHKVERPFSFVVPFYYYASATQIWSMNGALVQEVTRGGPFENIPIQGVPTGPRSVQWVNSQPQTLIYAEALDGGDWANKVEFRDQLFLMKIPASGPGKPEALMKLKNRYAEVQFLDESESMFVTDYERDKEWLTTVMVSRKGDAWETKPVFSLSENDDYNKPGSFYGHLNKFGKVVVAVDGSDQKDSASVFLSGPGASPEGERPFLRRMNLATLKTDELFRSQKGSYESFETFLGKDFTRFVTKFESQKISPRYDIREAKNEKRESLYADPNPFEVLTRIKKEIITYKRADGVMLSAVLYYPLDYKEGVKYPAVISAYPLEYTDAAVAGQVRGSQDRFEKPFREAIVYNALRGYVVLDDAQMPIIGHPETKNDTFIEQLVSGAKAAVDTLDKRGLIDRKRVGVIGHSYGAFMVAHLLTHSDLFAAGVAKSGAYNRTLTPYGFQGERRPFWKAKSTYTKLSPFFDAEKMKKPMLLMHGMADNNSGTFTMQSERYFEALKGQGANARLVLLPEESHGYASIESIEHVLSEIFTWYDKYLKASAAN